MCRIASFFLVTDAERQHVRRRALSSFFFPARQGAEGDSRHSDRNIRGTYTTICRQQIGWPSLNVVIFHL